MFVGEGVFIEVFFVRLLNVSAPVFHLVGLCCEERTSEAYKFDSRPSWHWKNCHFCCHCVSHGQAGPRAGKPCEWWFLILLYVWDSLCLWKFTVVCLQGVGLCSK